MDWWPREDKVRLIALVRTIMHELPGSESGARSERLGHALEARLVTDAEAGDPWASRMRTAIFQLGVEPAVWRLMSEIHDLRGFFPGDGFKRVLGEAIAWCTSVCAPSRTPTDATECLRNRVWRPASLHTDMTGSLRKTTVGHLVQRRADRLFQQSQQPSTGGEWRTPYVLPEGLQGGRLLYYQLEETLTEGASETESHGYFDGLDEPSWDTWLYYRTDIDYPATTEAERRGGTSGIN
jgi:hypothetical protein